MLRMFLNLGGDDNWILCLAWLMAAYRATGPYPISETSLRRIANLLSWADQRREWTHLKGLHRLG
jgi:hypothetical protein